MGFLDDFPRAQSVAQALDAHIVSDGNAITPALADLLTIILRFMQVQSVVGPYEEKNLLRTENIISKVIEFWSNDKKLKIDGMFTSI